MFKKKAYKLEKVAIEIIQNQTVRKKNEKNE